MSLEFLLFDNDFEDQFKYSQMVFKESFINSIKLNLQTKARSEL